MKYHRSGFTLIELAMAVLATGAAVSVATLMQRTNAAEQAQLRDARQVREIQKGMVIWGQQNRDWYPLPSQIGRDGNTVPVPEHPTQIDTSGAVYSIMVFNSLIRPADLISAAEKNEAIEVVRDYEHMNPKTAVEPEQARWDPKLRGTPFDKAPDGSEPERKVGNVSFAHLALAGLARRTEWKNSLNSRYPVVGNRGPEETSGTWDAETRKLTATTLAQGPTGTGSLTLLIHGPAESWAGNIVYNDNHVKFETNTHPENVRYVVVAEGQQMTFGDGIFLDESDETVLSGGARVDSRSANCFLGLFHIGPTRDESVRHEQTVQFLKRARWLDGMTR